MSEYSKPTVTPEDEPSTYGLAWHDSDILTEVELVADVIGAVIAVVVPD